MKKVISILLSLAEVAKSWLTLPVLRTANGMVQFDPAQRAFVIPAHGKRAFKGGLIADAEHPAWHPAIVFENTRIDHPVIEINQKKLIAGKHYTSGVVWTDQGYRTVTWMNLVLSKHSAIQIK